MNNAPPPPRIIIRADETGSDYWREVWSRRALLGWLAWRELLLRYKQTLAGVAWLVLRPLLTLLIFTLVFGRLARLPSEGLPYSLFVFTGLLPWLFFSGAVGEAGISLAGRAGMIGKIHFPRLILPLASMVVVLAEFAAGLLLLGCWMLYHGHLPDWRACTLPLWIVLMILTAMGPAIAAAALSARFRDFRHALPFILQLGLYASPVGFGSRVVPEEWRPWLGLNPMAGVIDGFRWALCGVPFGSASGFALSLAVAAGVLVLAIFLFRHVEQDLAEVV